MTLSPTVVQGSISANGGFIQADNPLATTVGLQVGGTWSGTLTFNVSLDGTTWFSVLSLNPIAGGTAVTSTTANGAWTATAFPAGMRFFQVVATAWTSGTANVTINLN